MGTTNPQTHRPTDLVLHLCHCFSEAKKKKNKKPKLVTVFVERKVPMTLSTHNYYWEFPGLRNTPIMHWAKVPFKRGEGDIHIYEWIGYSILQTPNNNNKKQLIVYYDSFHFIVRHVYMPILSVGREFKIQESRTCPHLFLQPIYGSALYLELSKDLLTV